MSLFVTMGIPAAGKTYWAEQAAPSMGATLLRTDALRRRPGINRRRFLADLEREAARLLSLGRSVIVDACCTQPDQRARWLAIAAASGSHPTLTVVHVDLAVALERNEARHRPVPVPVVLRYVDEMAVALGEVLAEPWARIDHIHTTPVALPTARPIEADDW